jgi:hypothetical protein
MSVRTVRDDVVLEVLHFLPHGAPFAKHAAPDPGCELQWRGTLYDWLSQPSPLPGLCGVDGLQRRALRPRSEEGRGMAGTHVSRCVRAITVREMPVLGLPARAEEGRKDAPKH